MVRLPRFKIRESIKDVYFTFRQERLIFYSEVMTFILTAAGFIILFLKLETLPAVVPLYYSLPWGEEQLVEPLFLFILPLSSMVFYLFNTFWAGILSRTNIFLSKILTFSSVFIAFLNLYTLLRIIFLIS